MSMVKLTPHFSLGELIESNIGLRHGVRNIPDAAARANLTVLAEMLEKVRAVLGHPVIINSGYRSPSLNALVHGARNSAHLQGRAADFVCPGFGSPLAVCRELLLAGIIFDKLIYEGTWVHIQIPAPGAAWRREIWTAHFDVGHVTYSRGLNAEQVAA